MNLTVRSKGVAGVWSGRHWSLMIPLSSFPRDGGSRASLKTFPAHFVAAVREREISPQRK